MNKLLGVIIQYFSFLFDEKGSKFVDSDVWSRDSAMVLLVADGLRMQFSNDRGKVFLDFQSVDSDDPKDWFSLDIVETLLNGVVVETGILSGADGGPEVDRQNASWHAELVKNRFADIVDAFSQERRVATEETMRGFEVARAKRLFGE